MHRGVSNNQEISQKKLKGIPKTVGYTRSHRVTEKQTALNGISPSRIDPSDGRFTSASLQPVGICTRVYLDAPFPAMTTSTHASIPGLFPWHFGQGRVPD